MHYLIIERSFLLSSSRKDLYFTNNSFIFYLIFIAFIGSEFKTINFLLLSSFIIVKKTTYQIIFLFIVQPVRSFRLLLIVIILN
jgi:hypothetical protein